MSELTPGQQRDLEEHQAALARLGGMPQIAEGKRRQRFGRVAKVKGRMGHAFHMALKDRSRTGRQYYLEV
jgi:hypothetical protein